MVITLRRIKGSKLTHNELDDNFEVLASRIGGKANASHIHSMNQIQGLNEALENKIDLDEVNQPNGILMLNAEGKVPASFLPENNREECDCEAINQKLRELENSIENKVSLEHGKIPEAFLPNLTNNLKVRYVIENDILKNDDEFIFIDSNVTEFDLSGEHIVGRVLTLRSISEHSDVFLNANVNWINSSESNVWLANFKKIRLIFWHSMWWQI